MTRPTELDGCVVLRQQPAVTRVSAAAVGMTHGLQLCGSPTHFLTCAPLYAPALCRLVHVRRWWVCCAVHACAAITRAGCVLWVMLCLVWVDGTACKLTHKQLAVTQPTLQGTQHWLRSSCRCSSFVSLPCFVFPEGSGTVWAPAHGLCACMLWAGVLSNRGTSNSMAALTGAVGSTNLHVLCIGAS